MGGTTEELCDLGKSLTLLSLRCSSVTWGSKGTVLTLQASLGIRGMENTGLYPSTSHPSCSLPLNLEPGPESSLPPGRVPPLGLPDSGLHLSWPQATSSDTCSSPSDPSLLLSTGLVATHSSEHQASGLLNQRGSSPPPGLCPSSCSLPAPPLVLTTTRFGFIKQEGEVGDRAGLLRAEGK